MSNDPAKQSNCRSDLLVLVAGVLLLSLLGLTAATRLAPANLRLDVVSSGRIIARHAIVGGLMLLGPVAAELLLAD